MRRRPPVEPRRAIFIGVEGESDRSFVRFLELCCERLDKHLTLAVRPGDGGDSVEVVKAAGRYLARQASPREFDRKLVLLDRDRLSQDRRAGRDAQSVASRFHLEVIFQDPNLEGVLIKLHQGHERRKVSASDTQRELRKLWPEYRKPPTADQLDRRFGLADLRRAAEHDEGLRELLEILEL